MGNGSEDKQRNNKNIDVNETRQEEIEGSNEDKLKAFIKKKLKPVHQEIIAPPGQ